MQKGLLSTSHRRYSHPCYLKKKLYHAGVSKIEIERAASKAKKAKVTIYTARPGIIIGKKERRWRT